MQAPPLRQVNLLHRLARRPVQSLHPLVKAIPLQALRVLTTKAAERENAVLSKRAKSPPPPVKSIGMGLYTQLEEAAI